MSLPLGKVGTEGRDRQCATYLYRNERLRTDKAVTEGRSVTSPEASAQSRARWRMLPSLS